MYFLIWRGPALWIVLLPIVGGILFGYGILHSAMGMEEVAGNITGFLLGCLATIGIDIYHRKKNRLALYDIGASSIFILFPAWLVGVIGFILGVVSLIRNT